MKKTQDVDGDDVEKELELGKKLLNIDKLPEVVKNTILDDSGNLNPFTRKFVLFFSQLQKLFEIHFYKSILSCSPEETWGILKDPKPFMNQVCDSFSIDYEKNVKNKLPEKELATVESFMPTFMFSLIYKKYVLTHMLSLPNALMELSDSERAGYYRLLSGEDYLDDESAIQKLMDVFKKFQNEIDELWNAVQDEWQNHTLDAYNKKNISKELMEFVMAETNKKKKNTNE